MKQLLLAIGLVAAMNAVNAQQVRNAATREYVRTPPKETVYMNDISLRAVRDFEKKFSKVTDGQWYRAGEGYIVKFTNNSIQHRSVYNGRGIWIYTIKYYQESLMPRNVRAQVKGTYYDYAITQVEEIDSPDNPLVYIVHMYDTKTWINVRIRDGEMDVLEEFDRG